MSAYLRVTRGEPVPITRESVEQVREALNHIWDNMVMAAFSVEPTYQISMTRQEPHPRDPDQVTRIRITLIDQGVRHCVETKVSKRLQQWAAIDVWQGFVYRDIVKQFHRMNPVYGTAVQDWLTRHESQAPEQQNRMAERRRYFEAQEPIRLRAEVYSMEWAADLLSRSKADPDASWRLRRFTWCRNKGMTLGQINRVLEIEGYAETSGAGLLPCPTKHHEIIRANTGAKRMIETGVFR